EGCDDALELVAAADERRDLAREIAEELVERTQLGELTPQTGRGHLKDTYRSRQITEPVLTQVDQIELGRQIVAYDLFGRVRDDDLAGVRGGHQSRGTVQRRAVVVARAVLGFSSVQTHAHPERAGLGPRLHAERTLPPDRRGQRPVRGRAHR